MKTRDVRFPGISSLRKIGSFNNLATGLNQQFETSRNRN